MARLRPDLSPEAWDRLDELLDQALDVTGPAREAFVASLPPDDAEALRGLLEGLDGPDPLADLQAVAAGVPTQVGRWRVGGLLGEGGMSAVYAATPVDGELAIDAAIKLMRQGPGTASFEERFRRERQILLQLRHPHIVRLLDGGRTPKGVPYYVMERVRGLDWVAWCQSQPVEARVRALVALCGAVDHAHQQLVVHCDLKPENVYVDAATGPRVLDFGIAKLTAEDGRTATGARLLTPRWAAPEQIDGGAVTVRTDVHALGLLLWTALTGQPPWQEWSGTGLLRAIAEQPLPRPSTVLPSARGDLDAIVQMATAKDPALRYRSAAALALDLQRALAGHAVQARSASSTYRLWRWMRSHPGRVLAGSVGVAVLVGWGATATMQAQRIRVQQEAAEAAAAEAEANFDLLVEMLEAADPAVAGTDELTARQVLDQAVAALERQAMLPRVRAQLLGVIGRVQLATANPDEAHATLDAAVDALTETHGPLAKITLEARLNRLEARVARGEVGDGTTLDALGALAAEQGHPDIEAAALQLSAEVWIEAGEPDEALERVDRSRRAHEALGNDVKVARALAVEGHILARLNRKDEARSKFRASLARSDAALGTREHPDVVDIVAEAAFVEEGDQQLALAREAVDLRRRMYGDTWATAVALNNLGLALESGQQVEEALALMREAVAMAETARGAEHEEVRRLRRNLAASLAAAGYTEGAEMLRVEMAHPSASEGFKARAAGYLEDYEAHRKPGQ